MYKKVEALNNFALMENNILNFWSENEIVQKNFELNKDGEYYTFYDGPPTANGKPHMGHVLTRVIKDTIPKYKTMKGYNVLRKGGLDTHGLPVELEVEKSLGISGKKDIEDFGVENFTTQCKESVDKYSSMWKDMSHKVGYWIDMDNPYVTYHNSYIESVWWALKQMWNKNLLYKGHKVLPYCPRCGTTLSTHEVGQGYKDVRDDSTIAKFKVKYEENKYILAWTTTPWTLPSNMALSVNRKYDYIEVKVGEETFLLAKELAPKVLEDTTYETLREFKGAELLGLEYEPLFNFAEVEGKAHVVIHGDFVTLSDGTGIVHTAPAYGEDDNLVCNQNGIGLINLVDPEGKFLECVTPWAGMNVKDANPKILAFMKENKMLFKTEKYLHSYPHCWRCDTPLLYYPRESWFVETTALKDKLIENKNKINWYPDNVRTGRFGDFLENLRDWGISRDRYWGTPLPIWECECGHRECVGSIEELKKKGVNVPDNIELHKPYIDNVNLKCEHCGRDMVRVKEVIDCWFDSGSMAFAQHHYPFENKEVFEANFPAQFISEAIDQTRGWFYTSLVIATVLFDKVPFENCIVLGHVLDKDGVKMSKHKGNIVEPFELLESYGADATRWYFYTVNSPWLSKKFAKEDVAGYQRKFLGTLWNVYSFYVLYAELDKFDPTKYEDFVSNNLMDKWIVSKLNGLVKTVDEALEAYNITTATLELENFVDDLSNWYIRRNRSRFWDENLSNDKIGAYVTLYRVLVTLTKVAAPFVPFMTEEIYRNLVASLDKKAPESVHLCRFPVCNESLIDLKLEERMDMAYKVVKLGRAARNEANIKNRQPLSKMLISTKDLPLYYGDIIKDELNIKEIDLGYDLSDYVEFKIKPNLPVLGKKYGKLIPAIKNFINEQNQIELAQQLRHGQTVTADVQGQKVELNSENLLVTMEGLEGYAFAGELSVGVVLDTRVTEELKEEGDLREIISKVQNMRKEKGFEVWDKITLYVKGTDTVINVVNKFLETIMKDTLTSEIVYDKNVKYSECNINGEVLALFLEKSK